MISGIFIRDLKTIINITVGVICRSHEGWLKMVAWKGLLHTEI